MTVILTNMIPTLCAGIHRDLLGTFTTCPTFHLQKVTIATVPIVSPAKPAKLTIARYAREFCVRVPTVVGIIEGTDLWRAWATGAGSSSCGRCRRPSTIGRSSRSPAVIAGTLGIGMSSAPRSPPAIAGTLDVGMGPSTPTTSRITVRVWRAGSEKCSRYRGSSCPLSIADSGPQIPYRGRQQASDSYSYPHPC